MKKPIGTYTTIDFEERFIFEQKDYMDAVGKRLQKELAAILPHKIKKDATILVTGLGNRFATPDALGPYVLEQIEVNRHLSVQYVGMELQKGMKICGMIPGVLGAASGAQEDSFYEPLLECPQYTKPPEFRGWVVPDVLRSGHHKNIATWRQKEALKRTRLLRPDLLERPLTKEEIKLLKEIIAEESERDTGEV